MSKQTRGGLLVTTALVAATAAIIGLGLPATVAESAGAAAANQGSAKVSGRIAEVSKRIQDTGETRTGSATPGVGRAGAEQLFNPAYIARTTCGGSGVRSAKPLGGAIPEGLIRVAARPGVEADRVPGAAGEQPLWDNLGDLTLPVTTSDPSAQRYVDQGIRLANGFNHAEALRSFRTAQRLDPGCAMCFWGEALVFGPTINTPMAAEAVAPAVAAITRAQALAAGATEKEQALIWALARRYSANPAVERATLDANYADAMGEVAAHYSDDDNIAALYAEAMMDTQPWDYWEADGVTAKGRAPEILAVLERVLARNPDHPAAIHLYIHVTEASTTPERAETYADRLGALMPGAGHIVHMPSHTYFRVGRYRDSVAANVAAVQADEAYLAQVEAEGVYPGGYYPHNIHYVVESARMAGADEIALDYAARLDGVLSEAVMDEVPWVRVIKASPYFTHAQFSTLETVLAVPPPTAKFPYVKAMWHYMRGLALTDAGDLQQARAEAEALAAIAAAESFDDMVAGGVPAPDVVRIAGHVMAARMARAEGHLDRAEREYRAAVTLQDGLAYMEPPFWYYPVRQSLGAVLLEQGKPAEAEQVFRRSLMNYPNNGWALYGLMRAQTAQQDDAGVEQTARLLDEAWLGDKDRLALARL